MWESTQRSSLSQKQRNNIHPKVEGSPWVRSTPERWFKSLIKDSSSGPLFTFANGFISHTWLDTGPSYICVHIFWKDEFQSKVCGDGIKPYYGLAPSPFLTPRSLPEHVKLGRSSWPQEWLKWSSFYSSRAQLLQLTFSLRCQREARPNFLSLTSPSCPQPRGPSTSNLSLTQGPPLCAWASFSQDGF